MYARQAYGYVPIVETVHARRLLKRHGKRSAIVPAPFPCVSDVDAWALSLDDHPGAIIFANENGAPMRQVGQKGTFKPVGIFQSVKCRRGQPWEAPHERSLIFLSEADADVVSYLVQPHRLELHLENQERPLIYYPDMRRQLADGTTEIIETKKDLSELNDPKYRLKLSLAYHAYSRLGWKMRIETADGLLGRSALMTNAKLVTDDKNVALTTADKLCLQQHLRDHESTATYGSLASALAQLSGTSDAVGRAKVHALVVRRSVRMPLDRPLTYRTRVAGVQGAGSTVARFVPLSQHAAGLQ